MRFIYAILLIISSLALAQQAPSEDTGIGGAPGGGFRYMDFGRAPNNNVKDVSDHTVAINNCQSKGGKIWGHQKFSTEKTSCSTLFCSKSYSEFNKQNYLSSYKLCHRTLAHTTLTPEQNATKLCMQAGGKIYSSYVTFKSGKSCTISNCSKDSASNKYDSFIAKYKHCSKEVVVTSKESCMISKDKNTIWCGDNTYLQQKNIARDRTIAAPANTLEVTSK